MSLNILRTAVAVHIMVEVAAGIAEDRQDSGAGKSACFIDNAPWNGSSRKNL